jgi:hypothetical protein
MPRGRRPHHQTKFYTTCLRLRAGQSSTVFAHESPTRPAGFGTENGLYFFALTVPPRNRRSRTSTTSNSVNVAGDARTCGPIPAPRRSAPNPAEALRTIRPSSRPPCWRTPSLTSPKRYGPSTRRRRRPPAKESLRSNNRAENSHQPTRRREGEAQRFKSPGSAQLLSPIHADVQNTFNVQRNLAARSELSETKCSGRGKPQRRH